MRFILILTCGVILSGCAKAPPLTGGKPIQFWLEAVRDPDVKVRKQAVLKLGNAGTADPAVLPALIEALRDRAASVRREAVLALVKCGPAAQQAVPALTEVRAKDADARVREDAAKALLKITDAP